MFDWHTTRLLISLARLRLGGIMDIRRAMMDITTRSSISVKPLFACMFVMFLCPEVMVTRSFYPASGYWATKIRVGGKVRIFFLLAVRD